MCFTEYGALTRAVRDTANGRAMGEVGGCVRAAPAGGGLWPVPQGCNTSHAVLLLVPAL
jgi:hypothetical protein